MAVWASRLGRGLPIVYAMRGRRDFASDRALVADRYDVVVTANAERARTLIAQLRHLTGPSRAGDVSVASVGPADVGGPPARPRGESHAR